MLRNWSLSLLRLQLLLQPAAIAATAAAAGTRIIAAAVVATSVTESTAAGLWMLHVLLPRRHHNRQHQVALLTQQKEPSHMHAGPQTKTTTVDMNGVRARGCQFASQLNLTQIIRQWLRRSEST